MVQQRKNQMPSNSKSQYRFFKFLEANPNEAKKHGIKESSVQDYTKDMTKDKWKHLKEKVLKKRK